MANHKSAIKRIRQTETKKLRNRLQYKTTRNVIKQLKDTINKKEIDKFSKLADEWWDPEGKFKPLHNFNPVRLRYIKDTITKKFGNKSPKKNLNSGPIN